MKTKKLTSRIHIRNNESPECVECARDPSGTTCCENLGGTYHPSDLGEAKNLRAVLVAGFVAHTMAVDWWEASPPIYFVRPASVGVARIEDPSWGGRCVNLAASGCSLSWKQRPLQCKALKPNNRITKIAEMGCQVPAWAEKLPAAKWWSRHQKLIHAAVDEAEAILAAKGGAK